MPLSSFASLALAEDNGVVRVHFYSSDGIYSENNWNGKDVTWGAYYWIDTGRTKGEPVDDEDFSREVDGVKNVGKLFTINLNASETRAIKQGKKLGLIMVRCYTDELGYFTPYWCQNLGKDLPSDRELAITFDSSNTYDVYIIAGDKNNYASLEDAKKAFERVESAKFDDFDKIIVKATKSFKAIAEEKRSDVPVKIYKDTDLTDDSDGEYFELKIDGTDDTGFIGYINVPETVTIGGVNQQWRRTSSQKYNCFDWNADYKVLIEDVSPFVTSIVKTRLYLSDEFQEDCIPEMDTDLGALYSKASTTFRYWAPVSTNVVLNLYVSGNELIPDKYSASIPMQKSAEFNGCWETSVAGDLNGVYYTYTNYVNGESAETVDIYAKAVGVNGNRGMVCDLDLTDPEGWENDSFNRAEYRDTAVIWEIHVRDFSVSPDNGITYQGKYLAFTEEGTHVKGDESLKTGIDYLKDLGVTYVHLNPVYDFSTVDEEYINNTDYTTKQNWGYDPKNYNVPEGSYATNAEDGEVRINEFKQMVQALHNAGIGVIMDVVYNHTYTVDSWFEKSVPGYYYRQALTGEDGTFGFKAWSTNPLGGYNFSDGSGCSNETASERFMYRKYMIDSLSYWANEYHIDGFRFDLMAIHDVLTMNMIQETLPDVLIYGEPWAAGALGIDPAAKKLKGNNDNNRSVMSASSDNLNELDARIAAFNDRMREGTKGNNDGGTGYVQGNTSGLNRVKAGINGKFLNYSGEGVISTESKHAVTYTTSHDNYTLWDQLVHTTVGVTSPTVYNSYNSVIEYKNKMAATLIMTSKGTAFMLAGEEIARTKFGNHNSYNAQDKVNGFDYYRQEEFSSLYSWYKGLIELRTKRFKTIGKSAAEAAVGDVDGCLLYSYDRDASVAASDEYSHVLIMLNPFAETKSVTIDGSWIVIADENGFDFNSTKSVSGEIELKPYASYIVVQK